MTRPFTANRTLRHACALVLAIVAGPSASLAQAEFHGPHVTLSRVADGVYATVFANEQDAGLNGNGTIIINDSDVLVVDTQDTPAAARAVIAELRRITHKPVRYVVNTHWHGDHHFGNQAYRDAFPGVEFISHPATREDIVKEEVPGLDQWVHRGLPDEIAGLERRLAADTASNGKPLSATQRSTLARYVSMYRWLLGQLRQVKMVLATMTVADSLILHRGDRTIEIRYLGRGNTRGDLVVYLPRERVLITGDLLVNPMPYAPGSFIGDWIQTLHRVAMIPADIIIPGHGAIQHDQSYLELVIALLTSTLDQVHTAVANGLDLEATRRAVNLDSLRIRFTRGDSTRMPVFDGNYTVPAVERAWRESRGELKE